MKVSLGRRKNSLRKRAERLLEKSPRDLDELSKSDAQSLIQELQVHQVELEIQNEELRRVQAELEGSRDKYADLYDFAPVGYFSLNEKGTILEANLTGATLLGVGRTDVIRQNFFWYIQVEDHKLFYSYRERLLKEPTRQTCELKMLKEDRTPFHSQLEGVAVFDGEGVSSHFRVAVLDVTVRKQAEEVLKRAHDELEMRVRERTGELTRANEALQLEITERKRMEEEILKAQKLESLGVLAGGIAHDFNNLLTVILGNISLTKRYVNPEDKIYKRLTEVEKASLRAKDLTQQFLTFSTGGAPVKKVTSIGRLIRDSANFALSGSNVRSEFSISEDLWSVEVDEGQINQVINNLVLNAQQAMPEGGVIKVRAENVNISEDVGAGFKPAPTKEGKYARITIEDEGIGIPEENLSKIFDPYFTTKKASGLGLATAYSIIRKHDGYIGVESELEVGTKFYVYLPAYEEVISPEERRVKRSGIEERITGGKGRILIMDDEETVREVAGGILRHTGYEVEFARDGLETIELYREAKESDKPFDVIMMDLTIPGGMGGKEAIKRLLEIDPKVKAIVSSGYSNDPVIGEYRKYGFRGAVAKPYRIQELSMVLHNVINEGNE